MTADKIIITPKTKVGELLDNFPGLESVLMEMSPAFSKLKNPLLRKTVARVATLQQVAVVGGLNVEEIVNRLRKEVGQAEALEQGTGNEYLSEIPADWLDKTKIIERYDASSVINSGGSPMSDILHRSVLLKPGEILELITPFIPAPIIDMLKKKNFKIYSIWRDGTVVTYILR
jgi:hypothetical protein